jgi:hypothetical protein
MSEGSVPPSSTGLKYTKENILLRRERVLELSAQGKNQQAIAEELGVDRSLIPLDLSYLKCMAAQNIKTWVDELIPREFSKTIAGYNLIIKTAWNTALSNGIEVRDQLSALQLLASAYDQKMNMMSNSTLITNIVERMNRMKKEIEDIQMNNNNDNDSAVKTTTNAENEEDDDPQAKFGYACDDSDPQMLGHYDSKLGHMVYEPWEYEFRDKLKREKEEYKRLKQEQGKTDKDYGGNRQF